MAKKIFVNDVTVIDADFVNSIFGGDSSQDPEDPKYDGHLHDGINEVGHASKIDLTNHTKGQLTNQNPELKSIRLSPMQAVPLVESLFWSIPIPHDAVDDSPFYLKIYWSATSQATTVTAAFSVKWVYVEPGENLLPPSVISGSDFPTNLNISNNPISSVCRFRVLNVDDSQLYCNTVHDTGASIPRIFLTFPNVNDLMSNFMMLGLEISTGPLKNFSNPVDHINIFTIELEYLSKTVGYIHSFSQLLNDGGLSE